MADPFVAEIRIFPFNFPPRGWAFCNGQLVPLSQNTALFALLGTIYGGDGRSTFALPDLKGNVPMHPGQGSGLSRRFLGESSGSETITLLESEMPAHAHQARALGAIANQPTAANNSWGRSTSNPYIDSQNGQMSPQALAPSGSTFPHNNMQPYLTLNFCIAMQGVFPPRS